MFFAVWQNMGSYFSKQNLKIPMMNEAGSEGLKLEGRINKNYDVPYVVGFLSDSVVVLG